VVVLAGMSCLWSLVQALTDTLLCVCCIQGQQQAIRSLLLLCRTLQQLLDVIHALNLQKGSGKERKL
jgi:hypothetical protein